MTSTAESTSKAVAAAGIEKRDLDVIISEQPKHAWGLMGECGDEIKLSYKVES